MALVANQAIECNSYQMVLCLLIYSLEVYFDIFAD